MKNLLKYGYVPALLLAVAVLAGAMTLGGCKKRPYTRIARMPLQVKLDWTEATRNAQIPETLKLFLFREDGTLLAQYDIPKEGAVLGLMDVGTYKAICVNVNDYVEVLKTNTFETAQVVAKKVSSSYLADRTVSKADDNSVIYQPGWVFSYSIPEIKVGDPLITDDAGTVSEVVFPMQKRVQVVNFKFTVTGLTDEIKNVRGTLNNVASVVDLSTGNVVCGYQAASPFQLEYQEDGSLAGSMLIFGNEADSNPDLKNNLQLSFETESGRTIQQEADITDQMTGGTVEGDVNIEIEANLDVRLNAGLVTVVITWKPGSNEDIDGI